MNKIKFKLISNNKEIINTEVNSIKNNDYYIFSINKIIYKFNYIDNVLIKKDNNYLLTIDINFNTITYYDSIINKSLSFKLNNAKLYKNKNYIKYSYEIRENELNNIIEIEY